MRTRQRGDSPSHDVLHGKSFRIFLANNGCQVNSFLGFGSQPVLELRLQFSSRATLYAKTGKRKSIYIYIFDLQRPWATCPEHIET